MAIQHLPAPRTHHHPRRPHYITLRTVAALIGAVLVTFFLTLRATGVYHSPSPDTTVPACTVTASNDVVCP